MRRGLQVLLALFGASTILIASLHIALGPAAIPGAIPVNSTMDSEDRFYATLFAAYGVALVWCIRDIEHKSRFVYFLAATFFVGGLARIVSMLAVGPPNAFVLAMTALELAIPPFMAIMQAHVARTAHRREGVGDSGREPVIADHLI